MTGRNHYVLTIGIKYHVWQASKQINKQTNKQTNNKQTTTSVQPREN